MEQEEETLTESIRTLQANEMYQAAVKRDMNYLEGEKNEWAYYREELMEEQKILRKASYVVFGMVLAFLAVILVLHVTLEMDVRILFTILMVAAAASGFFMLYRNQNNTREIKRAEVNMNHAITLLNHTKIKYVNSTNAVDYACEKYHVHNSYELTYLWEQYLEAKREREKFERNSDDLISQPNALVDKREMVEIKHELLSRRQKIRASIEYNMDVVLEQKEEIEKLMKEYHEEIPEVREIINSVDRLCGTGE